VKRLKRLKIRILKQKMIYKIPWNLKAQIKKVKMKMIVKMKTKKQKMEWKV